MSTKTKDQITGTYDPKNPNECLDLSGFDYYELTNEKSFTAYNDFVNSLIAVLGLTKWALFDFEVHKSKGVYKTRYPGIPNSPKDLVGIELVINPVTNTSFIHNTRITIEHAEIMNQQIGSEHSRQNGLNYYLLKKPKK